ncbi:secretin N-terminal domain-containing protein [Candidatus Omnitrophota bacterium]
MTKNKIKKIFLMTAFTALLVNHSSVLSEENTTQLAQVVIEDGAPVAGAMVVPAPIYSDMEGKISLDLRNIDVIEALKFLATKAGWNLVTTKNVTGRVTLMVENVPIKDIFDIMLRSNELAYTKEGDIYNIMSGEEYRLLFGEKFSDEREIKTFKLKYAIPDQAFTLLDTLKSDIGRILVEPDSGTVLIMDTPSKIKEIEEALAVMDEKNMVKIFNLQYARAKDLEEQLKLRLDAKKVGSIKSDERANLVIVQALPERMREIERLIKALDTKTKEVLIEAKIVKVKLTDQLDSGVKWEGLHDIGKKFGMTYLGTTPFSAIQATTDAWLSRESVTKGAIAGLPNGNIGSYPFSGTSSNYSSSTKNVPGTQLHLGMIDSKRDLDVLFKYLQTLGETKILSNPKLAVINNQEARIHVGERQAYVTSTTTTGQTTTTVSEEVTFVDVGIQLSVTPTINDDGYITMKIKPEISSVTSNLITPSGNSIPIIDTSTAETTVLVKDGTTIVMGGLRREEETDNREQVPILGKVPLVGLLFRSGTKTTVKTELLIMITPHIVSGDTLVTGDEIEFGYKPEGKQYKEYPGFTEDSDFTPAVEAPELRIKPYKEYRIFEKRDKNE